MIGVSLSCLSRIYQKKKKFIKLMAAGKRSCRLCEWLRQAADRFDFGKDVISNEHGFFPGLLHIVLNYSLFSWQTDKFGS